MNRADLRIVRSVQTPQLEVATPIEGGSLYSWPCLACKAHNWFKWEWRGGSGPSRAGPSRSSETMTPRAQSNGLRRVSSGSGMVPR